jgi:pseudouridine-5'-phosphate glycosidase
MSIQKAQELGIQGNALTPFLLSQVSALSEGKSLKTNIALLLNNGHVAGQIAAAIHKQKII